MISCLLIHVSRNQLGAPIRTESTIFGESIQIGRAAACKIHLQDHRVNLHHATLRQSDDGALYIESEGDATLKIDGFVEQSASLQPGMRIEIGPYLLLVEQGSTGARISMSVEEVRLTSWKGDTQENRIDPVTLSALGVRKRRLGYGLAAVISLLYLLLPMLPAISSALDAWQSSLPLTLTGSWSPGPMSSGHAVFGEKCSVCHRQAFRAVSDDVCTGCHKKVGRHLTDDVRHAGLFKDVRCADCHADHKGATGLMQHDSSLCVSCHAEIKVRDPKADIANVHDFPGGHPQFRLTLRDSKDGHSVIRVLKNKSDGIIDKPGLKFSHKVHLDKEGISTPQGDTVMVCHDCHRSDKAGIYFEPIEIKKSCQQSGCHGLEFAEPVEGVVPHGSERIVMERLRGYFAKWLADAPENMTGCSLKGEGSSARRTLDCADELAKENAGSSLFGKDGQCAECHEIGVSDDESVPWKVVSPNINPDWYSKSVFPHARHAATQCGACHDKTNSKTSADIAMPNIEKCRECHVDHRPEKGKVSSNCFSCHQFHGGGDAAK